MEACDQHLTLQADDRTRLQSLLREFWGHEQFRPLQEHSIACVLAERDSVVVLPTGGGKSICYQVPALCMDGMAVVVSPLISLMKDQVDALRQQGIVADYINSSLSYVEKREVAERVRQGLTQLLYIAPERLLMPRTIEFLKSVPLSLIAIDEAHCISQWGHDFRPEYRALACLREHFPNVAVHAFTATATGRVREDICNQLELQGAAVIVGSFDRPNLTYRIKPRQHLIKQVTAVVEKHRGESGIVYCLTRRDVDKLCQQLNQLGYRSLPYHAGLDDEVRRRNQDDFQQDRVELIVATVAFGMGIDKSDVRFVVHAAMPKSIEHYQQESGRAGRDGLDADCWMFYSGADYARWSAMLDGLDEQTQQNAKSSLSDMYRFCTGVTCRHAALVGHFGQKLEQSECQACDVCLGEIELVGEPEVLGQKILSCVVRLGQAYGADYTSKVLAGSQDQRVLELRHNELSTYGLLKASDRKDVREWIEQLVGQGFLEKAGEYSVLQVTETGWELLKQGQPIPKLARPAAKASRARKPVDRSSWEGVDRELFEVLRTRRTELAHEQEVAPYQVFNDASLRDMARKKPQTIEEFLDVHGVGEHKSKRYGNEFLELIADYLASHHSKNS